MPDEPKKKCEACGSEYLDRIEVDIGVGVQCGPWQCCDCGWTEDDGTASLLKETPDAK
jgi:hypothetical protein